MNNLAKTLTYNATVFNNKEATVNGGQIGPEAYAIWKSTLENAWQKFYRYRYAMQLAIIDPNKTTKEAKSEAFDALQSILDLIGEVNGHAIYKSNELLDELSKHTLSGKKELIGNASYVQSQLKNLKAEFNKPHNGASEEWVTDMEEKIAAKEEELKLEKKKGGSASKFDTRVKFPKFAYEVETALAKVINGQVAKTWEELDREEEARKAARKARAKEYRQAKRKAEKSNKPVETVAA